MLPLVEFDARHERLPAVFEREATFGPDIQERAAEILADVRREGDEAVRRLTARFDEVELSELRVGDEKRADALANLDASFRSILEEAAENVRRFHARNQPESWFTEEGDRVVLGSRVVPLERAGIYVPGGTAAYPSTVLMCAVPAQVAGVEEIHLVSPPGPDGLPHPRVLAAAELLGIEQVYPIGGAQAIGALAYGTESVPSVDKIVGPGNAYVAAAKQQVFGRVDIDSVAGPSEIVVLADETADPAYVAADLIAQAEHDERASAVLVTPSRALAERTLSHVEDQLEGLARAAVARAALTDFSARILTADVAEAVEAVNELAPEHLELHVAKPWETMTEIRHAGAMFLGPYSTEPVGDYWAGPNHVLPTGGTARYASALGVEDFVRSQSIIGYSRERLERDGPKIQRFAREEGLTAHAQAVRVRLDDAPDEEGS